MKASFTLVVPVAALLLLSGCRTTDESAVHDLAGPWAFHPGDDLAWSAPGFDDSSWVRLQVPLSWGSQGYQNVSGIAWYRLRVPRNWPSDKALGVTIGKVNAAYELYVDGAKIGGMGQLPPTPCEESDRHGTYALPFAASRPDVTLAMRVWRPPNRHPGEAGPTGGPFEIGPLQDLIERANLSEVDRLVLSCIFLVAGLYLFGLWLLRPKSSEYGWFAAIAVTTGIYCVLLTQWKFMFTTDFVLLKKAEHVILYFAPILLFQFIWAFWARPTPLYIRLLQGVYALGGVAVILSSGIELAVAMLPYLELLGLVVASWCLALLGFWAWRGDRNALVVGVGLFAITIAMTADSLNDRGDFVGPSFAAYGFSVMVVGMALSLAIRFHRAVEGLDILSNELEGRVQRRTAELADAYRRMEELALRDPLTNLLNRRSINERASAGLALAHRRGLPYSVALIDVDRFKGINDRHGHAAGDRVLVAIGEALASTARVSDDLARWGGEEFLLLLPDCDGEAALAVCERLRAAVESITVADDDSAPIHATVSMGVASAEQWGDRPALFEDLARRADHALYEAKSDGRNRIRNAAVVS